MIAYLALLVCYFLGAIPFGLIIGKLVRGIDIRDYGSGNIGATNALRILGPGPGACVFILDIAKGFAAVFLCDNVLGMSHLAVVAGAMLSILGHTFSVFLKFKGGKGVATSLGVIVGMDPVIALVAFIGWALIVATTRYISLASIVVALSVPLQMVFWKSRCVPVEYQILAGVAALAILIKHTSNIKRLMNGTESKFGQRVKIDETSSEE